MPDTTDTVTVSNSISYGITGPGGWFGGSGSVTFTATDSLGHSVAINWTIGGSSGTCASAPCTQPLPEGAGAISYTGTCSGGQTASGSDTYRLDLTPPSVSGSLSGGTAGSGGYYTAGPVTLTCNGSDVPSGLFGITYGSQIASGDGSHTLSCTAQDNGGNTASYSTVVRIDSTPPIVSLLCNGAACGAGLVHRPGHRHRRRVGCDQRRRAGFSPGVHRWRRHLVGLRHAARRNGLGDGPRLRRCR